MAKRNNKKKITKTEFKQEILADYRLISEVRHSGNLGRRDVLSGKGSLVFLETERTGSDSFS